MGFQPLLHAGGAWEVGEEEAGSGRMDQSSSASTLKPESLMTLSCTIGGQISRCVTAMERVPLPCVMLLSALEDDRFRAAGRGPWVAEASGFKVHAGVTIYRP
jgi:hypothetical protein